MWTMHAYQYPINISLVVPRVIDRTVLTASGSSAVSAVAPASYHLCARRGHEREGHSQEAEAEAIDG